VKTAADYAADFHRQQMRLSLDGYMLLHAESIDMYHGFSCMKKGHSNLLSRVSLSHGVHGCCMALLLAQALLLAAAAQPESAGCCLLHPQTHSFAACCLLQPHLVSSTNTTLLSNGGPAMLRQQTV
jgi:hypothetical protein